jgi:hypothetical protein
MIDQYGVNPSKGFFITEKMSERNLPPDQRRGMHRVILSDQDDTPLIGVFIPDEKGLGIKGGQGRTARELAKPFRWFTKERTHEESNSVVICVAVALIVTCIAFAILLPLSIK